MLNPRCYRPRRDGSHPQVGAGWNAPPLPPPVDVPRGTVPSGHTVGVSKPGYQQAGVPHGASNVSCTRATPPGVGGGGRVVVEGERTWAAVRSQLVGRKRVTWRKVDHKASDDACWRALELVHDTGSRGRVAGQVRRDRARAAILELLTGCARLRSVGQRGRDWACVALATGIGKRRWTRFRAVWQARRSAKRRASVWSAA